MSGRAIVCPCPGGSGALQPEATVSRHRSKEDRIQEILQAALEEIEARGVAGLTMEGVAARTTLSKGGVYRYFPGREALVLALFEDSARREIDFDLDAVIAWGLPLRDTLIGLLVRERSDGAHQRSRRVWLQLLPESLHKESFRIAKARMEATYTAKYRAMVLALVTRDGLRLRPGFEHPLDFAIQMGSTLKEGLTYRLLTGLSPEEADAQFLRFMDMSLGAILEEHDATA